MRFIAFSTVSLLLLAGVGAAQEVGLGLEPAIHLSPTFLITEAGDHEFKVRMPPGYCRLVLVSACAYRVGEPKYDTAFVWYDNKVTNGFTMSFVMPKWMINNLYWVKAYATLPTGKAVESPDYYWSVVYKLDRLVKCWMYPNREPAPEPEAPRPVNEPAPEPRALKPDKEVQPPVPEPG